MIRLAYILLLLVACESGNMGLTDDNRAILLGNNDAAISQLIGEAITDNLPFVTLDCGERRVNIGGEWCAEYVGRNDLAEVMSVLSQKASFLRQRTTSFGRDKDTGRYYASWGLPAEGSGGLVSIILSSDDVSIWEQNKQLTLLHVVVVSSEVWKE